MIQAQPGPHSPKNIPGTTGFTLLEIMVAISILALGLVAVLQLFGNGLRVTNKASERTQAVVYAQNIMEGFFARRILEDGDDGGDLPDGFYWTATVEDVVPYFEAESGVAMAPSDGRQEDSFRIKEISVTVRWTKGNVNQAFQLQSLRTVQEDNPSENQ